MPTLNKICDNADFERTRRIHSNKLNNIKSSVDTSAPKVHKHLKHNRKKEQMLRSQA